MHENSMFLLQHRVNVAGLWEVTENATTDIVYADLYLRSVPMVESVQKKIQLKN